MREFGTFAEERKERLPLRRFGEEVPITPTPQPEVKAAISALAPEPEPSLKPIEDEWLKTMELEGIPMGGPLRAEKELAGKMLPMLAPMIGGIGKPAPEITGDMIARSARRNWARLKKPFEQMTIEEIGKGAETSLKNIGKVYPVIDAAINTAYNFVVGFPAHMGGFVGGAATDVGEWMAGEGFDLDSARKGAEQVSQMVAATPFTEEGAQLLQALFGALDDVARKGGESAVDATDNVSVGAVTYSTLQILPYILGARLLRRGKEAKRALTEEDVKWTLEDLKEEIRPTKKKPPLEPTIAETPEQLAKMKDPIVREAAPALQDTPVKSSTEGLISVETDALSGEKVIRVGGVKEKPHIVPPKVEEEIPLPPRPKVVDPKKTPRAKAREERLKEKGTIHVYRGAIRGHDFGRDPEFNLGFHFAKSKGVADIFAKGKEGGIIEGEVKLSSPVRLIDRGVWSEPQIIDQLKSQKIISSQEASWLMKEGQFQKPAYSAIQKVLKDKGYDGIEYLNRRESPTGKTLGNLLEEKVVGKARKQGISESEIDDLINRESFRVDKLSDKEFSDYFNGKVEDSYIVFDESQIKTKQISAPIIEKEPPLPPAVKEPPAPKLLDQIRESLQEGATVDEIAEALEMTPDAVAATLARNKLFRPKTLYTFEDVEPRIVKTLENAKGDLAKAHKDLRKLYEELTEDFNVGFKDPFDQATFEGRMESLFEGIEGRAKARGINLHEGETLGFGGTDIWVKMYNDFVGRMKKRGKVREEPLSEEASEILDRGEIVKQRSVGGRLRPPVRRAEFEVLKGAKVLDENKFWGRIFQNPHYTFEEAGGKALLDLTMHPYHERVHAATLMKDVLTKSRKEISKGLNRRDKKDIMTYAVSKQKRGMALLKESKVSGVDITKATAKVEGNAKLLDTYNKLRERYENWYNRLNRVRESIGKKPFPKEEDYFTFIRNLSMMERMGFKPMQVSTELFGKQYMKAGSTPFRFARRRTGGRYRLELDPFRVLEIYEDIAVDHIQLSPLIAKMREYQTRIKDPVDGKEFLLANKNPVLAKAIHEWANHIAGMKKETIIPPAAERVLLRLNNNLVSSILSFMVRSALIQPTALKNTMSIIGFKYTAKGVASLLYDVPTTVRNVGGIAFRGKPMGRNLAMRKSKVLLSRAFETAQKDLVDSVKRGEGKRWLSKQGLKPLQILDLEAARATWQGGYEYAMKELGYNSKKAATYADDLVTTTQASALPGDISPVQRTTAGKVLTLFQTFVINDWNFMLRHVIGRSNVNVDTPLALARTMRWLTAATLFNIIFEDILGINSPLPTPIKATKESLEKGDSFPSLAWNVGKEFIEPIPVIGSARYGKGPGGAMTELASETVKFITRQPMAKPGLELGGEWLGIPGTAQIAKTIRARKREETPYGQIVGTYTPPEERAGRRSMRRATRAGRRARSRAR